MRVLIACEESQAVCKEFRKLGHEAYSCDILPCSGGHPEWHIQVGVLNILGKNPWNEGQGWDLMIAHPPCTYLTNAAACRLYPKKGVLNQERYEQGLLAKEFFMKLLNAPCNKIAIENPVSSKIFKMPKHTQEIQPFEHGHPYTKKTRLWIKGLPNLKPSEVITENITCWVYAGSKDGKGNRRKNIGKTRESIDRSKTFPGIAKAMAEQWGKQ